ncbi:hypothetical protein ACIQXW_12365 [Lysinibacillus sp. NPDC097162]|uniref:hypothetical protein n=1 Tax=Lysinibacillus sp. NPDC097162 TaxID=3364140 RepID=UPI003804E2E7
MENILNDTIQSYNEYLKKLPAGILVIADKLREKHINEALISIKDLTEGILWLTNASELLIKNNVLALLNIGKIQEFLLEVNEGLEKQDYVLIADIFEFEIAPFFEEVEPVNIKN